jgi:hypothetical protein
MIGAPLAWATVAWADLATVDSLAWTATRADLAVDAVVIGVAPDTGVVTLQVTRALFGNATAQEWVYVPSAAPAIGERVVAFAVRAPGPSVYTAIRVVRAGDRVFDRAGAPLDTLDAVSAHLWRANPERGVPPVFLPLHAADPDDVVSLVLPADRDTERQLQGMLRASDPVARATGAGALRRFESPDNIAALLALLDDPATFPGSAGRFVCAQAAATLAAWEVPVAPCAPG